MRLFWKLKNKIYPAGAFVRTLWKNIAIGARKAAKQMQKYYRLVRRFGSFRVSQSRIPRNIRRTLRYRLGSAALAAVLLITLTMGNLTFPINSARAETVSTDYDYSWLMHTGMQDDPYPINSAQALSAVADLVKTITDASSQKEVLIDNTSYIISGGALAAQMPITEEPAAKKQENLPVTTESSVTAEISSEKSESLPTGNNASQTENTMESTTPSAVVPEEEAPQLFAASNVISIPVGFAGRYFTLTQDVSLKDYNGDSFSGAGDAVYWIPIGIMTSFVDGTPFLGTFDGAGNKVMDFCFAPSPDSGSGYGLFGYIGSGATVKNLTVETPADKWDLGEMGGSEYAVGIIAAGNSGIIDNCTVPNAKLQYKPVGDLLISIGGIAGALGGSGAAITDSVFLGEIKAVSKGSEKSGLQTVGGLVGRAQGNKSDVTHCAAAVDLDTYNGTSAGLAGGLAGLIGAVTGETTVSGSFTTGIVRANRNAGGLVGCVKAKLTVSDSYSTVSMGNSALSAGSSILDSREAIGGLLGSAENSGTTLTNVYYAGGLLEPQFGSIAGYNSALTAASYQNTAVDVTQAPHGPYKYSTVSGEFIPKKTLDAFTDGEWTAAAGDFLPRLTWAEASTNSIITALSQAASRKWAAVSSSNAFAGNDGDMTLYRLRDGITSLGSLARSSVYEGIFSAGTAAGGLFTGETIVGGFPIPILRKGLYAPNQMSGNANVLSTPESLKRFLDSSNSGGGGYIGGVYTIPEGTIGGTETVPLAVPNYTNGQVFCSSLQGIGSASVPRFVLKSLVLSLLLSFL